MKWTTVTWTGSALDTVRQALMLRHPNEQTARAQYDAAVATGAYHSVTLWYGKNNRIAEWLADSTTDGTPDSDTA